MTTGLSIDVIATGVTSRRCPYLSSESLTLSPISNSPTSTTMGINNNLNQSVDATPSWVGLPSGDVRLELINPDPNVCVGVIDDESPSTPPPPTPLTISLSKTHTLLIGRSLQATLPLPSLTVSRRHAVIYNTPLGNSYIIDLGSLHGTFLNGSRITKGVLVKLRRGVCVRFGSEVLPGVCCCSDDDNSDCACCESKAVKVTGNMFIYKSWMNTERMLRDVDHLLKHSKTIVAEQQQHEEEDETNMTIITTDGSQVPVQATPNGTVSDTECQLALTTIVNTRLNGDGPYTKPCAELVKRGLVMEGWRNGIDNDDDENGCDGVNLGKRKRRVTADGTSINDVSLLSDEDDEFVGSVKQTKVDTGHVDDDVHHQAKCVKGKSLTVKFSASKPVEYYTPSVTPPECGCDEAS